MLALNGHCSKILIIVVLFLVVGCSEDESSEDGATPDMAVVNDLAPMVDRGKNIPEGRVDAAKPDVTSCNNGASAGLAALAACSDKTPATAEVFTDQQKFVAELAKHNLIHFDCVDTSGTDPVPIPAKYYETTHGAIIDGAGHGQYVDDQFGWPKDYVPSSPPNMYAPGPVVEKDGPAGEPETRITFSEGKCVAGFGAVFIDADYPNIAYSALEILDNTDVSLAMEYGFSGESGSKTFRGIIIKDEQGTPLPVINKVVLINGNNWPEQSCCEGVTLDDFVFGIP